MSQDTGFVQLVMTSPTVAVLRERMTFFRLEHIVDRAVAHAEQMAVGPNNWIEARRFMRWVDTLPADAQLLAVRTLFGYSRSLGVRLVHEWGLDWFTAWAVIHRRRVFPWSKERYMEDPS